MGSNSLVEWVGIVSGVATASGVPVLIYQLSLSRKQAMTEFADEMVRTYRGIVHALPIGALLGQNLSASEMDASMKDFYRYFDLCNQQTWLRHLGRIEKDTWNQWADGIEAHLKRGAFAAAWQRIKSRAPSSFSELQLLEHQRFQKDPKGWPKQSRKAHAVDAMSRSGSAPPLDG